MSTMVMTGGTSGFGAIAANRLRCSGDTRLLLGARRVGEFGGSLPLELAELDSVRAFAAAVRDELAGTPIDALILNAGLVRADTASRTIDGFETTFAVNHLAHYLILRLLLPALADKATVVLTTSGTHDPATGAGLTPPRHADAALLAHPERDPELDHRPRKAGEHSYTASKLCAVLTARALSEQEQVPGKNVTAIAYWPGQVFGTRLARNLPLPMRTAWSLMGSPVLNGAARRFDRTLNTRPDAASSLAGLASGAPVHRPAGSTPRCAAGSSPGRIRRRRAVQKPRGNCGATAPNWWGYRHDVNSPRSGLCRGTCDCPGWPAPGHSVRWPGPGRAAGTSPPDAGSSWRIADRCPNR